MNMTGVYGRVITCSFRVTSRLKTLDSGHWANNKQCSKHQILSYYPISLPA